LGFRIWLVQEAEDFLSVGDDLNINNLYHKKCESQAIIIKIDNFSQLSKYMAGVGSYK
jgi:hypothetical protein